MFKKLLDGLIFGTGFGIAFVIVWIVAMYFVLPPILEKSFSTSSVVSGGSANKEEIINKAPSIQEPRRFLGSPGVYSGGFLDNKSGVLSSGEGIIGGFAVVNEKPLEGLKLRLALNGSVMSQWATTDINGQYKVSVPYGEYKIDGFELDYSIANKVLPGKIDHPENSHSTGKFKVSDTEIGRGLKFRFIDPIIKQLDKTKYSGTESVILKWKPYPMAAEYTIQLSEKTDPDTWKSTDIFSWTERPSTTGTSLDLSKYKVDLKPGHFYIFEVQAKNTNGEMVSVSYSDRMAYDFEFTE